MLIKESELIPTGSRTQIVLEANQNLKLTSSKLYSKKLHLQELLAKRDRIEFEIRKLKRSILRDKKDGANSQRILQRSNLQLRTTTESFGPNSKSTLFSVNQKEIENTLEEYQKVKESTDYFLNLKPFDPEEVF